MSVKFLRLLFFWCVLSAPFLTQAQNLSGHNWYFGSSANGIRFSRSTNEASLVTAPVMPGNGGSAVASDPTNGNLLFYTNGATVFDLTGAPMANGTGLSGNVNGNQPAVVAQVPGQPNQYFLITNSADFTTGGNINYSIVDMTLNATPLPLGDVTATKDQPIGAIPASSEAMITVPHANGTDFWLITHQNGTNNYAVTLFTATGPGATTIIPSGSIQRAGAFGYNASTGQLAVSPQEANRNVELIGFDNATGTFTSNDAVLNSGVASLTTEAISDVEWSNNGQYLYISQAGEAGVQADVLQYDLTDPSLAPVSVLPQPPAIDFSYGLQMGPDSAIYHLYEEGGNFFMGKINDPDTLAAEANYEAQVFPANTIRAKQFPAAAPTADITITGSFTTVGDCMNSPVAFYPTVSPAADSLVWDFGDGSTSSEWSPVHTYEAAGPMTVTLTAYLNGEAHLLSTQVLNIQNFDVQINLVQDTTACSCELPYPKIPTPPCPQQFTLTADVQGSGSPQLQWYGPAGAMGTSNTLQPDSAGYYYLTATVGSCVAYAGVNIKEYDVQDQRSNIWYFGQNAGLDFNSLYWTPPTAGPTPISNPVMDAPEGTSTMSDRNGQVIFYTDGDKVWNRDDVEIASGIGGDPGSTQSAIIIPVPGDETLFYIFTTQEIHGTGTYELRYVLFDLKLNNGSGGIVDPDGNPATPPSTVLFTKSTERITGNNNWLIAHEYGNNSFRAYQITAEGISAPVISGIGSDHAITAPENGQGYMILGPQNQLTVAVNNTIEIFDFTDSSGVVTNFRPVDVEEPGQVYGIGFSPGGQRLYATILGQNFIYELAYDSATSTYTRRPDLPPIPTTQQPGAIQRGPDGQLYVALQGSNTLGALTPSDDTDDPLTPTTFDPAAVTLLGGTSSTLGLPNFIQSLGDPLMTPGMQANDGCLNAELTFTATGKDPNIDKFDWLFGDGTGLVDGGPETTHTYTVPGDYIVSVRVYNKCEVVGEFRDTVTVHPNPAEPPMLADANQNVICNNQPLTLIGSDNPQPTDTFLWSTGETTPTINVTVPNQYSVTVTNQFGCTASDTVDIFPYFSGLELGPDQIVCQNESRQLSAVQGPGLSYTWFRDGVNTGNTTRTQDVNTSIPGGPVEYIVTVSDAYCSTSDTVNFTINETPVFNAVGNDATCLNDDGSITLTVTGPTGLPLTYEAMGPVQVGPVTNVTTAGSPFTLPVTAPTPGLTAGSYRVRVTSEVSGCAQEQTVVVDDLSLTVTATREGTCDPIIRVQTSSVVTGDYNVINTTTNQTYGTFQIPAISPDNFVIDSTVPILNGDFYIIQIIAGGCQASSGPVEILPAPALEVSINDSNLCMDGTVLAEVNNAPDVNALTFDWSGSGGNIISGTTINPATVNRTMPATLDLHVEATDNTGGLCPGTATLTVTVAPLHEAQFTASDLCEDNVTLNAAPTGANFSYRWSQDGGVFPGGPSITVTSSATYSVEVVNTTTGCPDASDPQQVNVNGAFTVAVAPTNLPCDASPFTLTATPSRPAIGYQWLFNGVVIANETGADLIVREPEEGLYTVNAVAAPDCEASAETNIMLAPSPTVTILGERRKKICPEENNPFPDSREAVLEVAAEFSTYQWFTVDNGTSTPIPSETNPVYTATSEGTYRIVVTNPAGCPGQDQNDVFIDCDPIITAPNAFRPGSSLDANQAFGVFTIFVADEDFQVIIFNRWGEMVFQSSDRNFRWNGGYNNNSSKLLPGGTYAYVIRYRSSYDPQSGIQEKRGGVVLMR